MGVSTQRICAYLAVLAVVAGGVLGIVAIWTYVRLDIRSVKDDLSGRARQRILEEQRVHMAVLRGSQQAQTLAIKKGADDERMPDDATSDDVSTQIREQGDSRDSWGADTSLREVDGDVLGMGESTFSDELVTRVRNSDASVSSSGSPFEITRHICLVHADPILGNGRKA